MIETLMRGKIGLRYYLEGIFGRFGSTVVSLIESPSSFAEREEM